MEAVDYRQLCAAQVPEQYKRSGNLLGVIGCILDQCQELEAAFLELLAMLDPYTAVGPALDFIGALVGVSRKPGEGDESYRAKIFYRIGFSGLPSTESIRQLILLEFGLELVGLYPDYPAGLYVVFDGEPGIVDLSGIEAQITSGVSLTRGTFLRVEGDYMTSSWIVSEDTGKPFVIDYRAPDTLYDLVDDAGDDIVDSGGNDIVVLDY